MDSAEDVLPGYQIKETLGQGGYGTVYRARQLAVGREVALKIDSRRLLGERDRRRFTREVTAAGRLSSHPHVVAGYDAGAGRRTPPGRAYDPADRPADMAAFRAALAEADLSSAEGVAPAYWPGPTPNEAVHAAAPTVPPEPGRGGPRGPLLTAAVLVAIAPLPADGRTWDGHTLDEHPVVRRLCSLVLARSRYRDALRYPSAKWSIEVVPPSQAQYETQGLRTFRCVATITGLRIRGSMFRPRSRRRGRSCGP
jgi:hypothetical protein